jgi:hypothetical protein
MPKAKAPISFTIKRSPRTKQFHCVVRNEGNHEPTLTGEPCKNSADVAEMIANHIAAVKEGRFVVISQDAETKAPRAKKKRAGRKTSKATS